MKTTVRSLFALLIALLTPFQAQATQAALASPASPAAATLPVTGLQSNGTYTVAITNPKLSNGSIETLALQASVQGGKLVRFVRFSVTKDDNDVYSRTDNTAPFCLLGDGNNNFCNAGQAGDRWATGQPRMSVGTYAVQVEVFSDPNQAADWSGTVSFKLVSSHPVADDPGYGTGSGNGPLAEIDDSFYTAKGMHKMKVQANIFTHNGKPMKPNDVQYVWFQVQRSSDSQTIYSNIELGRPYCIFGEEAGGKICRTLSVGDKWSPSNRFALDANGSRTGKKENDPDIARLRIEPGEYNLSIQIQTNQGSWNSNGTFKLLP